MKINQLKAGSILSYVQMAVGIFIGLVYTPVMIRLLGQSEYGLYNTVASTISMMSVLSLGFSSSYVRFFSKYKAERDEEAIGRLNGMLIAIYMVIAGVVLLCGFYLTTHLELVFDEGLTVSEYATARVLMLLLTVSLAISFPMSVFTSIISAHEKFVFLKLLGIGKTVVGPLVTLPLLLMGYRSIAMVAVTVSVNLIVDVFYLCYVLGILKQKFIFGKLDKALLKNMFFYTFFLALNEIVSQINWNVGKILLGRFQGTASVAVYSVGYSLYQYYMMFSTSVSSVFTPRIHKIVNTTDADGSEQRTALTELFTRVGRIQFLILMLIATGVFFFGKSFIVNIWAGAGYDDSYWVAVLLIFSSSIALIQNLGIEVQRALNRHQFRSVVYIAMALLNLGVSILLIQRYGAVGASIGTAVALVVANGLIMNIYYHKRCNLDIGYFWKSILRQCVGLVPPVILGFAMHMVLDLNKSLILVGAILIYAVAYCVSVWYLSMNAYEKELVKKPLQKILRKRK